MSKIFEIKDRYGRLIRLTEERWKHIIQEHAYVQDIDEIKNTIQQPTKVQPSKYDREQVQ